MKIMGRQIPKNVRQIGNVSDSSKIYLEDYVDTFFNQLCDKTGQEISGAFLVGETVQEEDEDYIYVYGAIRMQELKTKGKDLVIEDSVWKNACETCKQYFENGELLGWFVTGDELPQEVNHNIQKMHQKYFKREKSLFVVKNTRDREEKYYVYKYKNMMECAGHYVYYEKNTEMQNYMIASRRGNGISPSETVEDRAAKNFRNIIQEKINKNEKKGSMRFTYGLSTCLAIILCAIGINMFNNYERMQEIQQVMQETDEQEPQKIQEPEVDEEEEMPQEEPESVETVVTPEELLTPEDFYIVKKGDTLASISKEIFGDITQVEAICKMNGLEDGNLIYIGQKLLLP